MSCVRGSGVLLAALVVLMGGTHAFRSSLSSQRNTRGTKLSFSLEGGLRPDPVPLQAFILGEGEARRAALDATEQQFSNPELVQIKVKESLGFSQLSEKINGRLAMVGLIAGLCIEQITGKSLLQQETDFGEAFWILSVSAVISLITAINYAYQAKRATAIGL